MAFAKTYSWVRQLGHSLPWLSVWYIQDSQCLDISNSLKGIHRHRCICPHETEEEYAGQSSSVLLYSQAFSQPWPCGQAGCRCRKKAANLSLWWREKRVGLGQLCHTPQATACYHGEPHRLWLQWNWQWHQSLPLSLRHQEHWVGGSGQCCPGMVQILMQLYHIWAKSHKGRTLNAIHPNCKYQWSLKWWPSWGKKNARSTPRQSEFHDKRAADAGEKIMQTTRHQVYHEAD